LNERHFEFWPRRMPRTLTLPETSVYQNLKVSATRYPEKTAIVFYGMEVPYGRLHDEVNALAGYLQQDLGVEKGDRVILYMQNSPQFVISYYAILRADAVVVPVNPMLVTDELRHYAEDSGAKVALVGQELHGNISPLVGESGLERVVAAVYSDYLEAETDLAVPDVVSAPEGEAEGAVHWADALGAERSPGEHTAGPEDLACLPYTSGTTGQPKGCMHTHRTLQATLVSAGLWVNMTPDSVVFTTLPLFHVTGMQHSMSAPLYYGASMVLMTRWDKETAAEMIQRNHANHWINISTMVVDFLSNPKIEGYEVGVGEEGEIVSSGPQVMRGYWNRSEADEESFFERDGRRFFRTGDIATVDEEGYFFMVDRLKRMINVSGYKVWPAEVESSLYKHPAIQEAVIIGVPDQRSGEAAKAMIVLREGEEITEEEIVEWSKGQMAAYKYPRSVEFIDELPKSGSGKILWRELQEREQEKMAKAK
jgi:acyl-CoA synthetase (AMP-forming)/AMP-acid ligase II